MYLSKCSYFQKPPLPWKIFGYAPGIVYRKNNKIEKWKRHQRKILKQCSAQYQKIISTVEKMKLTIKDFLSKWDGIRSFLRIWSHLLNKSLMENFIFCAV